MFRNYILVCAVISLIVATPLMSEDCSMVGGCEDTVGYIALKTKDGRPTYKATKDQLRVGDTIILGVYLHLRTSPRIDEGNGLRDGSKVKILEFYLGERELAVVRVISVP